MRHRTVLLVGESALTRALGYASTDFQKDEYLVETRGDQLILPEWFADGTPLFDTLVEFGEIMQDAYAAVGVQQPYLDRVRLMDYAIYGHMVRSFNAYWNIRTLNSSGTA